MVDITLPRGWQQQPPLGTPVDQTNPITKGLRLAFIPGNNPFPVAGARQDGQFTATNGNIPAPRPAPGNSVYPQFSFFLLFTSKPTISGVISTPLGYGPASVDNTGFGFSVDHGNPSYAGAFYIGDSYTIIGKPAGTIVGNTRYAIAGTYDGTYGRGYSNGVLTVGPTASGAGAVNSDTFCINQNTLGNNPTVNKIYVALIWDRVLSASEIASITASPWQVFEAPRSRQIFFTASGPPPAAITSPFGPFGSTGTATAKNTAALVSPFGPFAGKGTMAAGAGSAAVTSSFGPFGSSGTALTGALATVTGAFGPFGSTGAATATNVAALVSPFGPFGSSGTIIGPSQAALVSAFGPFGSTGAATQTTGAALTSPFGPFGSSGTFGHIVPVVGAQLTSNFGPLGAGNSQVNIDYTGLGALFAAIQAARSPYYVSKPRNTYQPTIIFLSSGNWTVPAGANYVFVSATAAGGTPMGGRGQQIFHKPLAVLAGDTLNITLDADGNVQITKGSETMLYLNTGGPYMVGTWNGAGIDSGIPGFGSGIESGAPYPAIVVFYWGTTT